MPKALINQAAKALAIPLTAISIPKVPTPADYNDIRPISMTTLWSKLLESFVASFTLIETGHNWKGNHHGGRKGSSTDHVLVQVWDTILEELDTPSERPKAAVLCGLDFSKSFCRCSYQQILESYVSLGASQWVVDMHAAFLTDRSMQVKVGNVLCAITRNRGRSTRQRPWRYGP